MREKAFQAQIVKTAKKRVGEAELSKDISLNFAIVINEGFEIEFNTMKYIILNLIDAKSSIIIATQDTLINLFQMAKDEDLASLAKAPGSNEEWMFGELQKLATSIKLNYIAYQTNELGDKGVSSDLFVLLPKMYAETIAGKDACITYNPEKHISMLGLNSESLHITTVDKIPLTPNKADPKFDVNVVEKITNLITKMPFNDPTPKLRLFYWVGHGWPGSNGTIGGINEKDARELIKQLSIRADFLYLSSCYTGGLHTENIKNDLEKLSSSHDQMIMVVQAFGDAESSTIRLDQDFSSFFKKIKEFLCEGKGGLKDAIHAASGISSLYNESFRFLPTQGPVISRQAALVYIPGSANRVDLQAINEMVTIIGNVQGKKYHDSQLLKDIILLSQWYVIVIPHKVDAPIIIKGNILPRIESKKGGPIYITFEKIKIENNVTLLDALKGMFASYAQHQAYSRKFLVKSLKIGSNKQYENVFIKVDVKESELEYYYKNSPEAEHAQTVAIEQEIEQFEKICTEQPDAASLDRTKIALEQIEKLVSLKIEALDSLRKSLDARLKNHTDEIKDYLTCKFKAQYYVDKFRINPTKYEASIEQKVSAITTGILIPGNYSSAIKIKEGLKQLENTYTPQQENISSEELQDLGYWHYAVKVKYWEKVFAIYPKGVRDALAQLEAKIEEKFESDRKLFEAGEKLRVTNIPQAQLNAKLTKLKKSLGDLKTKLEQLKQNLGKLSQKLI